MPVNNELTGPARLPSGFLSNRPNPIFQWFFVLVKLNC